MTEAAARWLLAAVLLLEVAPTPATAQTAPFPPPALATVQVIGSGEAFVVRVTDPVLLDQVWRIAQGLSPQKIVIGSIRTGNDGYNRDPARAEPWSWHLDESTLALADFTIELCDGIPSFVEADILGFDAGQFCPWSSSVVSVEPGHGIDADTNVDGSVDQTDADEVTRCRTAPGELCTDIMPSCCRADIDSDLDVDCDDFAVVESQWTAAGAPLPPAACAAAALPLRPMPWLALLLLVSAGLPALLEARARRPARPA